MIKTRCACGAEVEGEAGIPVWCQACGQAVTVASPPVGAGAGGGDGRAVACEMCGASVPADQVVKIRDRVVCARCKPELVKNLQSGVAAVSGIEPEEAERIRRKIRNNNALSFAFALPGLGLQFAARTETSQARRTHDVQTAATSGILSLVGVALLIVGFGFYARMRGRSPLWGALGILSCVGLAILYFVPKHCHHCRGSQSYRVATCALCGAPM
ncbi:MAG: hypothetical protein HZA54_14420 [Planctomycetes bacterium]|nr:hypothetical protein [Planctomycetota bacterium]